MKSKHLLTNLVVVSGGQTGVDRAALDWALHNKITCGGWCPKGRKSEDETIPERYPLRETWSDNSQVRTEYNVRDSSATLIIYRTMMGPGTRFTRECCIKYRKPFQEIDLARQVDIEEITLWIVNQNIETLNVAGPRESEAPGIYILAMDFLNELYNDMVTR